LNSKKKRVAAPQGFTDQCPPRNKVLKEQQAYREREQQERDKKQIQRQWADQMMLNHKHNMIRVLLSGIEK